MAAFGACFGGALRARGSRTPHRPARERAFEQIGEQQDVIMAYDLARKYEEVRRRHREKCDQALLDYLALGDTTPLPITRRRWMRPMPAGACSRMSRARWTCC